MKHHPKNNVRIITALAQVPEGYVNVYKTFEKTAGNNLCNWAYAGRFTKPPCKLAVFVGQTRGPVFVDKVEAEQLLAARRGYTRGPRAVEAPKADEVAQPTLSFERAPIESVNDVPTLVQAGEEIALLRSIDSTLKALLEVWMPPRQITIADNKMINPGDMTGTSETEAV